MTPGGGSLKWMDNFTETFLRRITSVHKSFRSPKIAWYLKSGWSLEIDTVDEGIITNNYLCSIFLSCQWVEI